MGVNIQLHLYKSAKPEYIAKAMSILAGNDPNPTRIGVDARSEGYLVAAPPYTLKPSAFSYPMGNISFNAPSDVDCSWHECTIHLNDNPGGFTWLLIPPSTPFWIALARDLVNVFGGALDYQDCDDSECDYFRFEQVRDYEGDQGFNDWQNYLMRMGALTSKDIEECRKFAAYDRLTTVKAQL